MVILAQTLVRFSSSLKSYNLFAAPPSCAEPTLRHVTPQNPRRYTDIILFQINVISLACDSRNHEPGSASVIGAIPTRE